MDQHSPYNPSFAGTAALPSPPGSPGAASAKYYGSPNVPTPALVYNQGEQYPASNYGQQNNNTYGSGVDQYGRPLSMTSGTAVSPIPMWIERANVATPASTTPSGRLDH